MKFGICVGIEKNEGRVTVPHAEYLKNCGFDYVELPLNAVAALSEGEFASLLDFLREKELPCLCCNCFMSGAVRMNGPDFSWSAFKEYVDGAVRRAKALGCRKLVLGSAASRNVPEGFDRGKAMAQFDSCLEYITTVCARAGITLILEHLNRGESNLVTKFAESAAIAQSKGSPSFKSILDTYHFCLEDEPLSLIHEKRELIGHIHFARTLGRTYPGMEDFPGIETILTEIRRAGYQDTFSMECSFPRMEEEPEEYGAVLARFKAFFSPDRVGRAMYLRKYKKYNCCQCVVCSYCDEIGVPEDQAFRLSEGLGGGIGGTGSVCGAVTGMVLVAGALASSGTPEGKAETYRAVRELTQAFESEAGSSLCCDLKGKSTGVPLKSCNDCIYDAVRLLEGKFGSKWG